MKSRQDAIGGRAFRDGLFQGLGAEAFAQQRAIS